jgi:hypothetical protein
VPGNRRGVEGSVEVGDEVGGRGVAGVRRNGDRHGVGLVHLELEVGGGRELPVDGQRDRPGGRIDRAGPEAEHRLQGVVGVGDDQFRVAHRHAERQLELVARAQPGRHRLAQIVEAEPVEHATR